MAGNRYVPTIFTALDINGAPIPGAKLYFYENNTTTPKDTWSDIDLVNANDWPVLADGAGRFTQDIFMDTAAYRIKLCDENDVQIWLKDDCNTFNGTNSANSFPFPGAVIEFYGNQTQLDVGLAALWYVFDGNNGLPNLDDKYTKTCIDVASIGTTGGAVTPTGAADSHVLTRAEMPEHSHRIYRSTSTGTTNNVPVYTGVGVTGESSGSSSYYGSSSADGLAETTGSSNGHSHTLTMDDFEPPFYQLIKLVYLGY